MSYYSRYTHTPIPLEVIVHQRDRPSVPFGFKPETGLPCTPLPERRVRDAATVAEMCELRKGVFDAPYRD